MPISFGTLTSIYYVAWFLSILPFTGTTAVVKILYLRSSVERTSTTAVSLAVDKLLDIAGLMLFGLIGALYLPKGLIKTEFLLAMWGSALLIGILLLVCGARVWRWVKTILNRYLDRRLQAIGKNLICIFVDNGLLRSGERQKVEETFREHFHMNLKVVDASQRFLEKLKGITDPEQKRKIIGNTFIHVFEEEAKKAGDFKFLAQGTLYPDVIESVSFKGPSAVIKSHHNVGGLPEDMKMELVEPLRELFKDEVRALGREMDMPDEIISRQPFPGPGLAIRIIDDVTQERITIVQEADKIILDEIKAAGLYKKIWQSFAVLLPVKTVGVMGDSRTYENVVAVRAVNSTDGMTADWVQLPYDLLGRISNRIINEVKGVNRVVYDISSKPPGTIEWE